MNYPNDGQVFGAMVQSVGLGIQDRKISVDLDEWEKCTACPDYKTCYDLSLGTVALQEAVLRHG